MGYPDPNVAAEWLTEEATNTNYLPLKEVLARTLMFRTKSSAEDAAEFAERLCPSVVTELATRAAEDRAEGVSSGFEVSGDCDSAYFRRLAAPELPLLESLRQMPAKDFENFCARILEKLGARAHTIGGSNDQGVDFLATNLQLGESVRLAPRTSQALVIGQAKRWRDKNISETSMREFVGGAVLQAQRLRFKHSEDAGILTPVVYAFWTTSDFHHSARKYAREVGVWYLNGIGLTQLAVRTGVKI